MQRLKPPLQQQPADLLLDPLSPVLPPQPDPDLGFSGSEVDVVQVRYADQRDHSAGRLDMLADSHEHMGNVVYLCQRGHHAVLRADGRLGHRAPV